MARDRVPSPLTAIVHRRKKQSSKNRCRRLWDWPKDRRKLLVEKAAELRPARNGLSLGAWLAENNTFLHEDLRVPTGFLLGGN